MNLNTTKSNPDLLKSVIYNSTKENWLHVFLFNSSIQAILSRMIIENYKIRHENILIVSSRNTDISIFNHQSLKINPSKYERYLDKLFFYSTTGNRVIRLVNKTKKNFLLYTPMADKETNWLLSKKNCKGHIYIENGQHSWVEQQVYSYLNTSFFQRFKLNWENRMLEGFRIRDDAHAFIGICSDSFPDISLKKKFFLKNIEKIKKNYSQKLKGIKTIGLTCASRRLKEGDLEVMLRKLISLTPKGAVIKPHPSFTSNESTYKQFTEAFNRVNNGKLKLCNNDVLLELEMLFEKKQLIGPQSSLSKYATLFDSNFKQVKLY